MGKSSNGFLGGGGFADVAHGSFTRLAYLFLMEVIPPSYSFFSGHTSPC